MKKQLNPILRRFGIQIVTIFRDRKKVGYGLTLKDREALKVE